MHNNKKLITVLWLGLLLLLLGNQNAFAIDEDELLTPRQAFAISADGSQSDKIRVKWRIAEGYYLYQSKIKFSTESPGITLNSPNFPIPIVGRVQAGEPILAVENVEGYINLDRSLASSGDVFLLRVQGNSMIDAHIQDGDFALVKPQPNAENGEIVVALIEDEATIKKIFKKKDLIRLEPANPKMEPIVVKKGEKKVAIVGKVVGIFRKI